MDLFEFQIILMQLACISIWIVIHSVFLTFWPIVLKEAQIGL